MKNKKILFFTSFPPPNTGQTIATKLIYDQLLTYFQLDVINTSNKNRFSGRPISSIIHFVRIPINYARLLYALIRHKYDKVYLVYSSTKWGLLRDFFSVFIIKKISNAHIIAHIHSGNYGLFDRPPFSFLLKYTNKTLNKIIFLSPSLVKTTSPFLENKKCFLPNMISNDIKSNKEDVVVNIEKIANNKIFKIIFVSNLIPEKGFWDLIESMEFIDKRISRNISISLVGACSSKIKKQISDKITNEELGGRVKLIGPISDRQELKNIYKKAHLFVLPTYYKIEAQPLSIIESFNSGTPVISTHHASIPEMVTENQNGFLVPKKNAKEISKAITKLYLDRDLWKKMALNSRTSYDAYFSSKVLSKKLLKIFLK